MLRGRIVAANGVPAEQIKPPPDVAWVLQSDRGITYSDDRPGRLARGRGRMVEARLPGAAAGLVREDALPTDSGSRSATPSRSTCSAATSPRRVANLRTLDWQSLGINFVMVFSPNTFRGAPNTHIATLTYPGGSTPEQETALLKAVADAFPAITTVRVRDAIDAVGDIVTNLVLAIRGASVLTLLIAVLVLGGALAAGHRHRVYDAVILKTLGATRARLLSAYALEYLVLGVATALFGVAAGSAAAAFVVTQVMNLGFAWLPGPGARGRRRPRCWRRWCSG